MEQVRFSQLHYDAEDKQLEAEEMLQIVAQWTIYFNDHMVKMGKVKAVQTF